MIVALWVGLNVLLWAIVLAICAINPSPFSQGLIIGGIVGTVLQVIVFGRFVLFQQRAQNWADCQAKSKQISKWIN